MRTYRLGQPEDWLKIPNISMLTHGYLSDAINQATGTILYIYQGKELIAAQDVTEDMKALCRTQLHPALDGKYLVRTVNYFGPEKLKKMLEHKVLEMLETKNK